MRLFKCSGSYDDYFHHEPSKNVVSVKFLLFTLYFPVSCVIFYITLGAKIVNHTNLVPSLVTICIENTHLALKDYIHPFLEHMLKEQLTVKSGK